MFQTMLIGNLTADPAIRTVSSAKGDTSVCSYTVAANDSYNRDKTTFVRISTWGGKADNDFKWLRKGSKVCVVGNDLHASTFTGKDGSAKVQLEMTGNSVEYLSGGSGNASASVPASKDENTGFVIADQEDLPF